MKCKVIAQGNDGVIEIEDGVRKSESIFPVDRGEENDLFVVAAIPKTMRRLAAHDPFCDMDFPQLLTATIEALVKAQGDPPTPEHTADLAEEYGLQCSDPGE